MSQHPLTVFILDDDPAVRDSLCWLMESMGWRTEAFATAAEVINRSRRPMRGCLVADLRLEGPMDGLELCEELDRRGVRPPTIMITGHGDVTAAVRAMKDGAFDFIEKPFSDQALLDRVREALALEEAEREEREQAEATRQRLDRLTRREREVMELVVRGRLNKQIAADLGLSHKTVEVHRAHVMEKMEAPSLAALVRMAVLTGVIPAGIAAGEEAEADAEAAASV
jgi:two-component system, LuxR family, response regulator FixJ